MHLTREALQAVFHRTAAQQETTSDPNALFVEPLDHGGTVHAGVDAHGQWALAITTRGSEKRPPALRLSTLLADFGASYTLHGQTSPRTERVSTIRCRTGDPGTQAVFSAFAVALIDELSDAPTDAEVASQLSGWASLFWRLRAPARQTATGLIGELTLLDTVADLPRWVRGWHSHATQNLDFAFSTPQRSIEVKATTSQHRVHELSMQQAAPVMAEEHFFASVIVEFRDSGVLLGDVVEELAAQLHDPDDERYYWSAVTSACGTSMQEYFALRYMREEARTSLRLYTAVSVPQPIVALPLPAGVSGVRFRSDFTSVAPVTPTDVLDLNVSARRPATGEDKPTDNHPASGPARS